MSFKDLKLKRYWIELYIKSCEKHKKFRLSVRKSYHYFSFKMSKNFCLDHTDQLLNLTELSLETYLYDMFRSYNNDFMKILLLRKSNFPKKRLIFKMLISLHIFLYGLKKIRLSAIFIFNFLKRRKIKFGNEKLCFFLNLLPPLDLNNKINYKGTIVESILKDNNSSSAIFYKYPISKKVQTTEWHFLFESNKKLKLVFLLKSTLTILESILSIFKKKKRYKFLMVHEIVQALAIETSSKVNNSVHFINSCSQGCYKPIWLKCSEKKFETETSFVWNSVSTAPYVFSKYDYISFNIPKMCWHQEYIMSNNHIKFLEKIRTKTKNKVLYKKLTYFDSFPNNINIFRKPYLVVFPSTPHYVGYTLGDNSIHDIYGSSTTQSNIQFISDILETCMKLNLNIVIKDKRQTYVVDCFYIKYLQEISKNKNVECIRINTGISKLIKNSIGCISYPVTSTAEIATLMGKPSSIYTINHTIKRNNIEFLGNKVLVTKKELNSWIKELV